MTIRNSELMKKAKVSLSGNWMMAILANIIYFLVIGAFNGIPKFGWIASMLITGPMLFGMAVFFLSMSRKKEVNLAQLFDGFKIFKETMVTHLMSGLFIFLWSLLLIIPGIIKSIAYSQIFFILADNPKLGPSDVLKKSEDMMRGNKWKFFCLLLRFTGWFILSLLTLGIGFIWLIPYVQMSRVKFYEDLIGDLKNKKLK